jgi:hypothetical protein
MLIFLVLAYCGPALWSMYRMIVGTTPPELFPVVAVVPAFMAWLSRPI